MDLPLRLRLGLDEVKTEHIKRPPTQCRQDLLTKLKSLRQEADRANIPEFVVAALSRTSEILLDIKRPNEALEAIHEARQLQGSKNKQNRVVDLYRMKANAYAQLADWPSTSKACGEGIELIEFYRRKLTTFGTQSAYLRFRIELYQLGARAALTQGDFSLALQRAEMAKCSSSRRMRNAKTRDPEKLAKLQQEYRNICEKLDDRNITNELRTQLLSKRRVCWDSIAINRFKERENKDTNNSKLEELIDDDEAILYYFWIAKDELVIFLITNIGILAELKQFSKNQIQDINHIPNAILNFERGCGALLVPGNRLSSLLIPDSFCDSIASKKTLQVSPHRQLHLIPFHAFTFKNHYLIDQCCVSFIPNLSPLIDRYQPVDSPRLFAIGVSHSNITHNGKPLVPINNACAEISDICDLYTDRQLEAFTALNSKASEDMIRTMDKNKELSNYDHLHIVCHGTTVDSDSPMESRLILSDSDLDGLDIAGLTLDADLVVLSACCSGQRPVHAPEIRGSRSKEELPGDELFGLQAAFFAAGARQIVSALWPVESEAAQNITYLIHQNILSGLPPDRALQKSLIHFKSNARLAYRSVEHWAPFFLVSLAIPQRKINNG